MSTKQPTDVEAIQAYLADHVDFDRSSWDQSPDTYHGIETVVKCPDVAILLGRRIIARTGLITWDVEHRQWAMHSSDGAIVLSASKAKLERFLDHHDNQKERVKS